MERTVGSGGGVARTVARGRRRGARVLLALASMGVFVAVASPAKAAPDAPLDPKRIFAQSEPATVMILASFSADTVVPSLQVNTQALQSELTNEVQSGQLASDPQTLLNRSIELIVEHPDAFIVAGAPRQAKAEFQATGSGFIIDETGYVVTNAHVAAPHDDEIKQQLAQVGLKSLVEEDAKSMQQEMATSGLSLSDDLAQKLLQADQTFIAQHLQVSNLQKKFSAVLGANIPGVTTTMAEIPGDVVAAGDPIPGRDVAILKLEQKNLPTLALGDDAPLRPGDRLYVLGYPGAATFHPLISKESITEPSFTAGTMSARKVSTGGFEVLQTDAAVTHGNSGGPVFDEHGKVVGIATFGSMWVGQYLVLDRLLFARPTTPEAG